MTTLLLLILLTSCARPQTQQNFDDSLAAAISDGFIMSPHNIDTNRELNLTQATLSHADPFRAVATAMPTRLVRQDLTFYHADRALNNIYVEEGELVNKGDILASTIFDPPDILLAEQRLLQQESARFETTISNEYSRLRSAMEEFRMALYFATDDDWERYSLQLSLYELRLENLLLTRNHERANFRRRQAEMTAALAPEQLIAPFCGMVTFVANLDHGALVESQRIVAIADPGSLLFTTRANPGSALVRYGDTFLLEAPNIMELYVRVVSDSFTVAQKSNDDQINHYLAPVNPQDIDALLAAFDHDWIALERTPMRLTPPWNMFGEGIIMPERNIHWDGYRAFVFVYENGSIGRRFVTVASYSLPGRYVYVISGLEPGQWVVGND